MNPDRWLALTVTPPDLPSRGEGASAALGEAVTWALWEMGGQGVEEAEGSFTAYLEPPEDLESFLAMAREHLRTQTGGEELEIRWRWQPQEDWDRLWRQGLGPRKVTPRLWVAPSWDLPQPGPGELLITLDPGVAFGTAEHATTRGCLRLLDSRVRPGDRVADVGAGSGILSIAAVLMGAGEVLALEMDEPSCQAARENIAANQVADRVRVVTATVEAGSPLPGTPYHGVAANIQSTVLTPLLRDLRASLVPGGWLVLSGILLEEEDQVVRAAEDAGFTLEDTDEEGEWWSGAFRASS